MRLTSPPAQGEALPARAARMLSGSIPPGHRRWGREESGAAITGTPPLVHKLILWTNTAINPSRSSRARTVQRVVSGTARLPAARLCGIAQLRRAGDRVAELAQGAAEGALGPGGHDDVPVAGEHAQATSITPSVAAYSNSTHSTYRA